MPCRAVTKRGTPCKAQPWKGTEYCSAHQDREKQEVVGFGGAQPNAGRKPLPKVTDVLRERIEANVDALLNPIFDALGADVAVVVGNGPTAHVEMVADHRTRLQASRDGLDRVYGRPKQSVEATGEVRGMVLHLDARDEQTRVRLHELLRSRPEIKEA